MLHNFTSRKPCRYTKLECVGRGGSSKVFKARELLPVLNPSVACTESECLCVIFLYFYCF